MTARVVVSDQVFPSVELERAMLREIDASLEVSDGTVEGPRGSSVVYGGATVLLVARRAELKLTIDFFMGGSSAG